MSLVEGNRGLLDGLDAAGTHSTAALARLLGAPVLLVVNAAKVTRTVGGAGARLPAARPGPEARGVVLNRVAGARHERAGPARRRGALRRARARRLPRLGDNLLPGPAPRPGASARSTPAPRRSRRAAGGAVRRAPGPRPRDPAGRARGAAARGWPARARATPTLPPPSAPVRVGVLSRLAPSPSTTPRTSRR